MQYEHHLPFDLNPRGWLDRPFARADCSRFGPATQHALDKDRRARDLRCVQSILLDLRNENSFGVHLQLKVQHMYRDAANVSDRSCSSASQVESAIYEV